MNIINKIFDRIINREVKQKNNIYWNKIIKIFDLIQILLLYHEKPIDINQRLIST